MFSGVSQLIYEGVASFLRNALYGKILLNSRASTDAVKGPTSAFFLYRAIFDGGTGLPRNRKLDALSGSSALRFKSLRTIALISFSLTFFSKHHSLSLVLYCVRLAACESLNLKEWKSLEKGIRCTEIGPLLHSLHDFIEGQVLDHIELMYLRLLLLPFLRCLGAGFGLSSCRCRRRAGRNSRSCSRHLLSAWLLIDRGRCW